MGKHRDGDVVGRADEKARATLRTKTITNSSSTPAPHPSTLDPTPSHTPQYVLTHTAEVVEGKSITEVP